MLQRQLGQGFKVSAIGLGCMGMSDFYGDSDKANNLRVLDEARDIGVSFWDTSDIYGPHTNEQLLGEYFASRSGAREQLQLATKFGILNTKVGEGWKVNGRPEYVRQACEDSLKRLKVEHIDLYYQHRIDPDVPIEETVGAMAELVKEGKVRYLGLSEASHRTIERAHRVHPISAVQMEYSLWSREVEAEVLPTCQRLGIGLVPYSPLGRGFLTGAIRQRADLQSSDWRLQMPRFQQQAFDHNMQLVDALMAMAERKGVSAAQLALAWLLAQDPLIVPIPGTRSTKRLAENAAASECLLSDAELTEISQVLQAHGVEGDRYYSNPQLETLLFADTPELA
ncbi:aldo/keto reductase [Aliagarivorans marinus]|uniref:aldo/keto reductase n=1 Tax=Aliagarivorans marinus TaxID=561965 RepID=UPI0003FF6B01|nr:aldo/keto reductase [Aliagarivorans marinus]